ncbi:type II secretion system protein [Agaricicola taiwanensis]|uniref:Type II secretion system protein n=1 Tax=Agaricicola taiwanensis TaxID=591372 RepID=A0A8J2VMT5_9RHOB|nr:type II secretion system F family protein [Agaricicola taiwanensis]GGE33221.1 type II secretion system protein [Agaricicola taiwanensis]
MFDLIIEKLRDTDFLVMTFTAIAAMATVLTLGLPLLAGDDLNRRMKTVALERDKIRARERERLAREDRSIARQEPKAYMRKIVEQLKLSKYIDAEVVREQLAMAGYRGQAPLVAFTFFRFAIPILVFSTALIYLFVIVKLDQPPLIVLGIAIGAAFVGVKLPDLYIKNVVQKRQLSIRRAFPDALDLLLICVESGMSIEAALRRVSDEIGEQSPALAEELIITTAEMSYLQDRRLAYENLGKRTGLETVRSVVAALIQAEKFGTPIGQAMRVLAQESRDMRMADAEKKAAGLPPKLTVPMVLFFLPVIFIVILGPAAIRVMGIN